MAVDAARAKSIFLAASELPNLAERADYLVQQCGSDVPLRARVDALLRAHDAAADLGDEPSGLAFEATMDAPRVIQPGTLIAGRYKLLEAIGEGGMGAVWLAEQKEPIKRKVAVKLIKPGMDSRQVLARFEAERQALALMDHPNIAKVFDGGMTAEGRPFFVMEFVKGIPLTEYSDQARLSLKERLNLFTPVCQAVQHAHQKGIIHRDLKPSNILICLYDGKPVPKVIDFGLAKAMHQSLTEQSLHTAIGMMVGTPLYMSPEQAEHNNLDVDTRTDIYSLGVILYELLTGSTPLERQQLKQAAFNEILRLIKEVEPPKPSTRLSGSTSLPSIAAQRSIDPRQLSKSLAGDLDWIVMKALDKERSRRYETANGLARDIERFLDDEAVEACPPNTAYRLKKFIHRNRLQVIAASLVFMALVLGIVGTSVGLYQANQAREAENQQRKLAEAKEREAHEERAKALAAAEKERQAKQQAEVEKENALKAAEAEKVAKLEADAKREEAVRNLAFAKKGNELLGSVFAGLDPAMIAESDRPLQDLLRENLVKAVKELEGSAIGDPLEVAAMQITLGQSLVGLGDATLAVEVFEKARDTFKTKLGPNHPDTLKSMNSLAQGYESAGRWDESLSLYVEVYKLQEAILGPNHPETLRNLGKLAGPHFDVSQAIPLFEEALKRSKAELGPDHADTLEIMNSLARAYLRRFQTEKALLLHEDVFKLQKAKLGLDHPDTLTSMFNLANNYHGLKQDDKALPLYEEVLKLRKTKLGPDHPDTLFSMNGLARCYGTMKQLDKSIPLFEELLPLSEKKLGRDHPRTLQTMAYLGTNYQDAGRVAEAIPLLEEAYLATNKSPQLGMLRMFGPKLLNAYSMTRKPAGVRKTAGGLLEDARTVLPKDKLAAIMTLLGKLLVETEGYTEAELMLREGLAIREKQIPDDALTFYTQTVLGGALLGQKKFADAEPLLLKGYEGMKARENTIPPEGKIRLPEALERLVQLYTDWHAAEPDKGHDAKAAEWQKKLKEHQAATPTLSDTANPDGGK